MKTITTLLLATAVAALAACGGDGNDPNRPIDPLPLRIDSGNQVTVARATLSGGFAVARTSTVSVLGADRARAQSAGPAGLGSATGALDSAVRAALAPLAAPRRGIQAAGPRTAAVIAPPADHCTDGGTRSASVDDRDGNSATSAGDVVTVTFAGCRFDQVVLDGTMVMTVAAADGDTSLSGAMQFQHVKVAAGSVVTTITGAADVTETESGTETDTGIVARSPNLSVAVASPSYTDTVTMFAGFTISTVTTDADGATVRVDGAFQASSLPTLEGVLHVTTVEPVVVSSASAWPTAGQLRVTDDFHAVLLLSVHGTTDVDLKLDADGDGLFEGDTVVPWTTLLPH